LTVNCLHLACGVLKNLFAREERKGRKEAISVLVQMFAISHFAITANFHLVIPAQARISFSHREKVPEGRMRVRRSKNA
jgi:hypothetical protein